MKVYLLDARDATWTVTETREVPTTGDARNDRRAARAVALEMLTPHMSGGNFGRTSTSLPKDLFLRLGAGELLEESIPSTVAGQTAGHKGTGHGTHFIYIER